MPGIAYLDASALVKLVVEEPESWALGDLIRDRQAVSSDLARVELPRSVRRLGLHDRARKRTSEVLGGLTLLKIDRAILARAAEMQPTALRSLDAIHLASALSVGEIDAFVTYDRRLAEAADLVGLPTTAPA